MKYKVVPFMIVLWVMIVPMYPRLKYDFGYENSPVETETVLNFIESKEILADIRGVVNDIYYIDETKEIVLVTDNWGLYVLDDGMSIISDYIIIDPSYPPKVKPFHSFTLFKEDFIILSYDRSYVLMKRLKDVVEEEDKEQTIAFPNEASVSASPKKKKEENLSDTRLTLDTSGEFYEASRSNFISIRGRKKPTLAIRYYLEEDVIYTISDQRKERLVVSKFSTQDFLLMEEFYITLSEGIKLKENRSIDEYMITGIEIFDEKMYLLSKQYSSVIVVDMETREIISIVALESVENVRGIGIRESEVYILGGQNDEPVVYFYELGRF